MENMIKTVCVFSSSSSAVNSVYRDTATDLGKRLGQESFDLIFGGAVSKSAQKAIDYIKHYTPKQLPSKWF